MRNHQPKREPLNPCPLETVLALIQPKWTARILHLLLYKPHHFGLLRKSLPGISQEVLAVRLEALTVAGLVSVQSDEAGRKRIYSVTPYGRTLEPVLVALAEWGLNELHRHGLHWESPIGLYPSSKSGG